MKTNYKGEESNKTSEDISKNLEEERKTEQIKIKFQMDQNFDTFEMED